MATKSLSLFNDKDDFERFFRAHYQPLCQFAFSHLKNLAQAEEVVQESFLKLWNNRNEIHIHSSLKSYLYSTVRNSCLNELKHERVKEKYRLSVERQHMISEDIENEIFAAELKEKIHLAIERMPDRRQRIFKMSRIDGLKYNEIAERLDIAYKTVENHMGLAMKFLREELKEFLTIVFFLFWL